MTILADKAVLETDSTKRNQMYLDLQLEQQQNSPFVIMFQEIEVLGAKSNVKNFIIGPSFNTNSFQSVTK
jgi:peptide/nickel transport system substrate-binding protein